jgi:methyl-accepting chemotaxis protein
MQRKSLHSKHSPHRLIFFQLLLILVSSSAFASTGITVGDRFSESPMLPSAEFFLDEGGTLSPAEVMALDDHLFFKRTQANAHFGYPTGAVWIRFKIRNTSTRPLSLIIETEYPLIDSIALYRQREEGFSKEVIAGDSIPFASRALPVRSLTLPLTLEPETTGTFLIRAATTSSMQLPFVLRETSSFWQHVSSDQFGFGALYGLMIVMVLYNLIVYFSTRDKSYLYYCLYIFAGAAFLAALYGHGYQHLWPNAIRWQNTSVPFLLLVWTISSLLFTRKFLGTATRTPRLDRTIWITIAICGLIAVPAALGLYALSTRLGIVICIFVALLSPFVGIRVWLGGYRPARFFNIAWIFFCGGVILFSLKSAGVLPSNALTSHALAVGVIIQTVLNSMALGDMIQILTKQMTTVRQREQLETAMKDQKMAEIRRMSADLEAVAQVMNRFIQEAVQASNELAAAVQQTNTTINELQRTGTEVERRAGSISTVTRKASDDWRNGGQAIDATARAMVDIQSDSFSITQSTESLLAHLEVIDEVVTTVRTVADHSRVLSVNASIEASSAGVFGKGFAVIAGEINSLANQSDQATIQVTALLGAIKSSLRNIINLSRASADRMSAGGEAIDRLQRIMTQLSAVMKDSSGGAGEIASSIAEQTRGLNDMQTSMQSIQAVTQANQEGVAEIRTAATDVNHTVARLTDIISRW